MIRLFNENGCETPTDTIWGKVVYEALNPLVKEAVEAGLSLRDLQTLVVEEISLLCAQERLIRGMREHRDAKARRTFAERQADRKANVADDDRDPAYYCWHKIPYGGGPYCTGCGGLIKSRIK